MKIRELSITNCLSFGNKGLNENNSIELGDFNLFIGSNNAGKSNVLKIIEILEDILKSIQKQNNKKLHDIPLSLSGEKKDWFFAQNLTKKMHFSFSLEIDQADGIIQQYEPKEKNPVWLMFELKKGWPKVFKANGIIEYKFGNVYLTINKVEIPNDRQGYSEEPLLFDKETGKILALRQGTFRDELIWKIISLKHDEAQWQGDYSRVGTAVLDLFNQISDKLFRDLIIIIRAIRKIEQLGDEIVESLFSLSQGSPEKIELHDSVIDYIKSLVFADESQRIRFVYPEEKGKRHIKIQVGRLQLPLSHYGSGVEQMLSLAAEIVRHSSNKVFLIEEPEAHFYPDLQRKFIRFLRDNQKNFNHQYLIATHSSTFINEFFNMNGKVFCVHCEQDKETEPKHSQVEPLDEEKLPILFKTLGIRPADLLLANGILVVEGPIDKDVYTDWARKIEKPFEEISLEVIDVEGVRNIKKYLLSNAIQRSCFQRYALYDKSAEEIVRKAIEGIVPDENITPLKKGDIEDYYPRELVVDFAREFAPKKGKTKEEIPNEIKEGETVKKLNKLLNGDWWKRNLAEKVIKEMKPEQIDDEVKIKLTEIYDSIY